MARPERRPPRAALRCGALRRCQHEAGLPELIASGYWCSAAGSPQKSLAKRMQFRLFLAKAKG
eukprot:310357-Pleurochrysis_carterae.AAC.1